VLLKNLNDQFIGYFKPSELSNFTFDDIESQMSKDFDEHLLNIFDIYLLLKTLSDNDEQIKESIEAFAISSPVCF